MRGFKIKRIYDDPSDDDGYRILVDRLWPRGISKAESALDEWNREIAPSPELRKWFDHKKERFEEFSLRYRLELKDKKEQLDKLRQKVQSDSVCLLYAAKDPEINQAVILKEVLEEEVS